MFQDLKEKAEMFRHFIEDRYCNVVCRVGGSEYANFDIKSRDNYENVDFAVYINYEYNYVVVWHLYGLDNCTKTATTVFTYSREKCINFRNRDVDIEEDYIFDNSIIGCSFNRPVIIMNYDVFVENYDRLLYFKNTSPINNLDTFEEAIINNNERIRSETSRVIRDYEFRRIVLDNFNHQCAICRCNIDSILQACHIQAVYEGGSEDINNGICLCANHHLMFDRGLISFTNDYRLVVNDECIKLMPWYNRFYKDFGNRLVIPRSRINL